MILHEPEGNQCRYTLEVLVMTKNIKILIVDDVPRNLRILEEILEDEFLLEQAEDSEQTLQQVKTFGPDLILLDGMMPGKSGSDVCKELKSDERFRHIKIILVTGKASGMERNEGLLAGADDYVSKPFEEAALMTAIHRVMSRS